MRIGGTVHTTRPPYSLRSLKQVAAEHGLTQKELRQRLITRGILRYNIHTRRYQCTERYAGRGLIRHRYIRRKGYQLCFTLTGQQFINDLLRGQSLILWETK